MIRSGAAAVRYLTCLPVPGRADSIHDLRHAAAWFPLVGASLGVIVAAIDMALFGALPWPLRNAMVLVLAVTLSGAIHLDALMDATDGLASPRALAIDVMRASIHTPHGVIAGALTTLVTWLALQGIAGPERPGWIAASMALGRSAIVLAYWWAEPRPGAGPVTHVIRTSARSPIAVATLAAVALASVTVLGPMILAIIAMTWLFVASLQPLVQRHAGGPSGDHYGAVGAVIEPLTLLVGAVATIAPRP